MYCKRDGQKPLKIVADRHITQVANAFSDVAEVETLEPGAICRAALRNCDVLMTRSVTRVDADLLAGTPVRFVGTATSGTDHVDTDYLAAQGIAFADASGSNARPVVEYVLSALSVLADQDDSRLGDLTVGIIGCGRVGTLLNGMLETLGVCCLLNDPPLAASGDPRDFRTLDEILQADVVTLHVPLTLTGEYPTRHLLGAEHLQRLRPGAAVINTARGGVVDESALNRLLLERHLQAVIDVWENEPYIDSGLLASVAIATPHIAGYSLEAKLRATWQLRQAVTGYFGLDGDQRIPPAVTYKHRLMLAGEDRDELARLAILTGYDVRTDAVALRQVPKLAVSDRGYYFNRLRHEYALRREFSSIELQLENGQSDLAGFFERLGFK